MNYAGILEKRHFSVFSTRHIHNEGIIPTKPAEGRNARRNSKTMKLRTNSIFAFHNDDLYSNLEVGGNLDDRMSDENGSRNHKADVSNFFSNCGENFSCGIYLDLERKARVSSGSCSVSSGIEKNFDFLESEEQFESRGELNKAQLDPTLEVDGSNSSHSQLSENYDEVDDFSPQNKQVMTKRLSLDYGMSNSTVSTKMKANMNLLVQTKLNKLESSFNPSNSFDFTGSNYTGSPETSSPIMQRKNMPNKFINTCNNPSLFNLPVANNFNCQNLSFNLNSNNVSPIKYYRNDPLPIDNFNLNLNQMQPMNTCNVSLPNNNSFYHSPNDSYGFKFQGGSPIRLSCSNQKIISKPPSTNSLQFKNISNGSSSIYTANMYTKHSSKDSNKGVHQEMSNSFTQFEVPKGKAKTHSFKATNIKNLHNKTSVDLMQDDSYVLENTKVFLWDQNGCRLLQKKIEEKSKDREFLAKLFFSMQDNLIEYINDQFGNYVIQKYFECVFKEAQTVKIFFERMEDHLISICLNPYGTRFFQKALELITPYYNIIETEKLNCIFKNLLVNHTMELILDTNGNHVFQKILILYPKKANGFIYEELTKSAFCISKLKQGGCIFQRALDFASNEQKHILVMEILKYLSILINDEYGNFIIQQIVYLKENEFNEVIFNFLKSNFVFLAKKKFSSNVIDKCILVEDPANKNKMRNDIIQFIISNNLASELISDQYGNYVIQKALQVSDGFQFMTIIHVLKQSSYGRKIYEKLFMQYGDYFQSNKINTGNDERRKSQMNSFVAINRLGLDKD